MPIAINEIFVDGTSNYPDWIELYNTGDSPVSLQGCVLTKNLDKLQWPIKANFILPPHGYKVFYCDKRNQYDHTSFRLTSITGEVGLFSPQGTLIDSIVYDNLPRFSSLGKAPDGDDTLFIYPTPTKGTANPKGTIAFMDKAAHPISISPPAGLYKEKVTIRVSRKKGVEYRYTLDGSVPNAQSQRMPEELSFSKTAVVRIAAFTSKGQIIAQGIHSYILNKKTALPIVSLTIAPKNLWDEDIGIYAEGSSPQKGGRQNQNWRKNWRRPAHIEFFSPEEGWAIQGKARIFGGASRGRPQKSFAIFTTSKKTPYALQQQLFPDVARKNYAGFLLRNGGDAWLRSQIRDAFIHSLVKGRVACGSMPYRPVIVYLNGSYWGVYGLRESMMRKNLLAQHQLPIQGVKLLEGGYSLLSKDGPFAAIRPLSAEEDYRPVLAELDIEAFLDYLAVELYSGNPDWPDGNIKCWRPKSKALKWQWILFDLDRGYNGKRGHGPEVDPFDKLYARHKERGLMFPQLAKNKQFIRDFCSRLTVHMLTTFEPTRAEKILSDITEQIRPEMQQHINRWRWDWKLERLFMTMESWEQHLDEILSYSKKRQGFMLSILNKRFAVGDPVHTDIQISKEGRGTILAEGILLENGKLQGLVPNTMEMRITAVPDPGYAFAGWESNPTNKQPQILVKAGKAFTDCALFKPIHSPRTTQ